MSENINTEKSGWRWYIVMWGSILKDALACNLTDGYMLKVKLSDMRCAVNALEDAEAEVERFRKELKMIKEFCYECGVSVDKLRHAHTSDSDNWMRVRILAQQLMNAKK